MMLWLKSLCNNHPKLNGSAKEFSKSMLSKTKSIDFKITELSISRNNYNKVRERIISIDMEKRKLLKKVNIIISTKERLKNKNRLRFMMIIR